MGYRSDIKMIITNDNKNIKTDDIFNKLGKEAKEYFKDNFKIEKNKDDIDYIYFWIDDYKGYRNDRENYVEIDDVETWISGLDDFINKIGEDKAGSLGYHFIRVGENYDDFEERYSNPQVFVEYARSLSF